VLTRVNWMKNSTSAVQQASSVATWRKIVVCALIALVGINLRTVILGVPPILPLIQHDLRLSYTVTGLLTALPVLVLGISAWLSGLLAERIGERACVSFGLALLGGGALLRALWPTTFTLLLFTLLLSLGIALGQTAVPPLARRWFPAQIGLVTAVFSDGLIIGESVAAGLTVPLMVRYFGADAWGATFLFWGIPVLVSLFLWLSLAPPIQKAAPVRNNAAAPVAAEVAREKMSKPAGARVNGLHLGIMLGANSLIYFGMNGWIASYNQAMHVSSLTPLALAVLNLAQLPASIGVTFFAQSLAGRRWPFIISGAICALAVVGWVFAPPSLEILWAALLGGSSALIFTLGIALPPLLAKPGEVARLTGTTLSLTYCVAFVGPLIGGQLWDILHIPAVAFLPIAAAGVTLVVLGALLPPRSAFGLDALRSS
jgi:CP family cyanate transporter-like MFS transporter